MEAAITAPRGGVVSRLAIGQVQQVEGGDLLAVVAVAADGGAAAAVTRIVAGAAGGRRLPCRRAGTRPTSDRVREALFSALAHDLGARRRRVLDLCAGSGALGLEALSRGAAHVLLVERDRRAAVVLRRTSAAVGLPGAQVRRAGGRGRLRGRPSGAVRPGLRRPAVRSPPETRSAAWLAPRSRRLAASADATVVVERPSRRCRPIPWPRRLRTPYRERTLRRDHGSRLAAVTVPVMSRRRLPRLLRSRHQRTPRHHRPRGGAVRRGRSSRC